MGPAGLGSVFKPDPHSPDKQPVAIDAIGGAGDKGGIIPSLSYGKTF